MIHEMRNGTWNKRAAGIAGPFPLRPFLQAILAKGRGGPVNRVALMTPVPFERILRSNQEPQNWLTYSGSLNSQRHSALTQINPGNAADLVLKWVFQSRSLDKHEVTPLVVDGLAIRSART
jgi:hypothetical protein